MDRDARARRIVHEDDGSGGRGFTADGGHEGGRTIASGRAWTPTDGSLAVSLRLLLIDRWSRRQDRYPRGQ